MRAYQEQDFDKMAARAVDSFMGGGKLADAATLEAQQGQLNPDQIARLVQAANTMAFLRLMEQQKAQGVPDMTGEFDPIDPRQVIQQIVEQTSLHGYDTPSGMSPHGDFGDRSGMQPGDPDPDLGPLPDEGCFGGGGGGPVGEGEAMMASGQGGEPKGSPPIDDDNDGPFPKGNKQKAKDDADKKDESKPKKKGPPEPPKKDEAKEAAFRGERMRKFAAVLEDQYKQAEWAFEDEFVKLEDALARAHGAPPWDVFEKDAMSLTGGTDPGLAVLHLVRTARKLPAFGLDDYRDKIAAMADRHIVDDNAATRSFERLVRIATDAHKLRAGAEHVRSRCG